MSEPLDPGVYSREEFYRGAAGWGVGYGKTARIAAMGESEIRPHPWYVNIPCEEWWPYESVSAEWYRGRYEV